MYSLLKPCNVDPGENADTSHKLQACVQDLINIDMPACCRIFILIYTLATLEDEAPALLLRLPLACIARDPTNEHSPTAAEHGTMPPLLRQSGIQCDPATEALRWHWVLDWITQENLVMAQFAVGRVMRTGKHTGRDPWLPCGQRLPQDLGAIFPDPLSNCQGRLHKAGTLCGQQHACAPEHLLCPWIEIMLLHQ